MMFVGGGWCQLSSLLPVCFAMNSFNGMLNLKPFLIIIVQNVKWTVVSIFFFLLRVELKQMRTVDIQKEQKKMTVADQCKAGPSWFNDQPKSSLGNMSTIMRGKKKILIILTK